jgi:hypothetical protein
LQLRVAYAGQELRNDGDALKLHPTNSVMHVVSRMLGGTGLALELAKQFKAINKRPLTGISASPSEYDELTWNVKVQVHTQP